VPRQYWEMRISSIRGGLWLCGPPLNWGIPRPENHPAPDGCIHAAVRWQPSAPPRVRVPYCGPCTRCVPYVHSRRLRASRAIGSAGKLPAQQLAGARQESQGLISMRLSAPKNGVARLRRLRAVSHARLRALSRDFWRAESGPSAGAIPGTSRFRLPAACEAPADVGAMTRSTRRLERREINANAADAEHKCRAA